MSIRSIFPARDGTEDVISGGSSTPPNPLPVHILCFDGGRDSAPNQSVRVHVLNIV